MKKFDQLINIVFCGLLCVIVMMLGYAALYDNNKEFSLRNDTGFYQLDNYLYHIEEKKTAPLDVQRVYQFTLDDRSYTENTLAFYIVHHYADVYIDDELVYQLSLNKNNSFLKTIGSNWVFVPLYQSDVGKTIKIVATPVYESVKDRNIDFLIGSKQDIYSWRIHEDLPQLLISAIILFIGVLFLFFSIYLAFHHKNNIKMTYLGLFSILLGLWKISDTRASPLLFPHHSTMLSCLSILTLMIVAIPLLKLIRNIEHREANLIFNHLIMLFLIGDYVMICLQLFHIADLRETLFLIHIFIILSAIILIGYVIYYHRQYSFKERTMQILVSFCTIGGIIDVCIFYVRGHSSGLIFTLLGFLMYTVLAAFRFVLDYIHQEQKIKEQETELMKNRISIMISQIQPHFLYNSLNTIYHLCEKNPLIAKRAISDFSEYLRVNVDSLKRETPVSFDVELKHVKTYLALEKMRFDDDLNIIYDIQETHFSIPALTIQPLVENAVKHGLKEPVQMITITIRTQELEDHYQIEVIDDGVGFDFNNEDGPSHVGLRNVKNRLKEMCRGTLLIRSAPGQGTHVIISIPKSDML